MQAVLAVAGSSPGCNCNRRVLPKQKGWTLEWMLITLWVCSQGLYLFSVLEVSNQDNGPRHLKGACQLLWVLCWPFSLSVTSSLLSFQPLQHLLFHLLRHCGLTAVPSQRRASWEDRAQGQHQGRKRPSASVNRAWLLLPFILEIKEKTYLHIHTSPTLPLEQPLPTGAAVQYGVDLLRSTLSL